MRTSAPLYTCSAYICASTARRQLFKNFPAQRATIYDSAQYCDESKKKSLNAFANVYTSSWSSTTSRRLWGAARHVASNLRARALSQGHHDGASTRPRLRHDNMRCVCCLDVETSKRPCEKMCVCVEFKSCFKKNANTNRAREMGKTGRKNKNSTNKTVDEKKPIAERALDNATVCRWQSPIFSRISYTIMRKL